MNGFLDGAFCVVFNITWSFLEALGFGLRELFMIFFPSFPPLCHFSSSIVSVGILASFYRLSFSWVFPFSYVAARGIFFFVSIVPSSVKWETTCTVMKRLFFVQVSLFVFYLSVCK